MARRKIIVWAFEVERMKAAKKEKLPAV